jgi:hypothetical protein
MDGKAMVLTNSAEEFIAADGPAINYSTKKIRDQELHIAPHGLLEETGTKAQDLHCFGIDSTIAFFKTTGDTGFDIFAAAFFLLTRYEEYLPHGKDVYGRYAHENSLAFRDGFLDTPLVNEWLEWFAGLLQQKFPGWKPAQQEFKYIPTYDVDEAYAHKHKSRWRSLGGLIKALLHGNWGGFMERISVLKGKIPDPYDSFQWMDELHGRTGLHPLYFFLVAEELSRYDRNIMPSSPAMQILIKEHAARYRLGIHPSWQSGDDEALFAKEIATLERISGKPVNISRQHYIRLSLPDTYQHLIKAGISEDYSMGYGSINGFRASIASPYYWYDLSTEQQTDLKLFPFCFMEANSFFEQEHSTEQAEAELKKYFNVVRSVNGTLITIWHNTFLGTAETYKGWREVYDKFLTTFLPSLVAPKEKF